jgi:hypothetical protein
MNTLRVVTRDSNGSYTVLFSGTRSECRAFMLGRWGHFPPFAAITSRTSNYHRVFGC